MRLFILSALIVCATGAPTVGDDFHLPRLPLNLLLKGTFPVYNENNSRITGGGTVVPHSLPFMASLNFVGALGGLQYVCSATIINSNTILIAAHSITGLGDPTNYRIVLGDHNKNTDEPSEQILTVGRIVIHENFDSNTYLNDIALINTYETIDLSTPEVGTIALPPVGSGPVPSGTEVTIAGWGTSQYGGAYSTQLRSANVSVVSDEECRMSYASDSIADSMLCAGVPEGSISPCDGDSGGPLFTGTGDSATQWGIVSWGYSCGVSNFPGVYTELTYFVDWINANMNPA